MRADEALRSLEGALGEYGPMLPLDRAAAWMAVIDQDAGDPDAWLAELDKVARACRVTPADTGPVRLARLHMTLFHDMGFKGDMETYDAPENSRLGDVLQRRRGLPILLAALMHGVGERVGLELELIGFPGHFLVGAASVDPDLFVDPFHEGERVRRDELVARLKRMGMPQAMHASCLQKVSHRVTLVRMANNLIRARVRTGELQAAKRVERFRASLQEQTPAV